ncbi:MAG: Flp family type IVb pilin [Phycisphaerae bacterium]|nr:Flp family type IVb pilin [Phycisphaerae bacterium]
MKGLARKFLADEAGLESVEYAVLMALIVAGAVVALLGLAGAITGAFDTTSTTISDVPDEP